MARRQIAALSATAPTGTSASRPCTGLQAAMAAAITKNSPPGGGAA